MVSKSINDWREGEPYSFLVIPDERHAVEQEPGSLFLSHHSERVQRDLESMETLLSSDQND